MTQTNWDELIEEVEFRKGELSCAVEWGTNSKIAAKYLSEACTALRSAIDELESQLKAANEDAERLAEELELEQNPGYSCEALRLHRARLARKEGE